jgi:hypothetical protein
MIATRGAVASFHCLIDEPCLRSFAYSSALRYADDATASALDADADARVVHQVEHLRHAAALLGADELADADRRCRRS